MNHMLGCKAAYHGGLDPLSALICAAAAWNHQPEQLTFTQEPTQSVQLLKHAVVILVSPCCGELQG
jgi:hypothetical protein